MPKILPSGKVSPSGRGLTSAIPPYDIVIVGDAWSRFSVAANTPIPRPGFDMIRSVLKGVYPLSKIYTMNAIPEVFSGNPPKSLVDKHVEWLNSEIIRMSPKLVVACGASAAYALTRKTSPMQELRGTVTWNPDIAAKVLTVMHPGGFAYSPESFVQFKADLEKIPWVLEMPNGPIQREEPETRVLWSYPELMNHWQALASPPDGVISCDIETAGFDFLRDDILSIGFGVGEKDVFILSKSCIEDRRTQLALTELFKQDLEWVFQNGKFDVKFMKCDPNQEFFPKKKVVIPTARCTFDTMLAHYCLDATQGTHGLKAWAKEEFFAPDWDAPLGEYLKTKGSSYADIPEEVLYRYQAYDVYYTLKGYHRFKERLISDGTWGVFRDVYSQVLPAFIDIEMEGIPIDRQRLQEVYESAQPTIAAAKEKLSSLAVEVGWDPEKYAAWKCADNLSRWEKKNRNLPPEKRAKLPGKPEVPKVFNPASHPQLSYVAYDLCKMPLFEGKKTCAKDAVDEYRHRHSFWKGLAEYKQVTDLYGTFIKGMLERTEVDDRIRPDFVLHGTRTGRISCQNPNMQNLPRSSIIKDFFVADPGHVVVNADYKTLEVVVAAILSGDKAMQQPFIDGEDFHTVTTESVFGGELKELQAAAFSKNPSPFKEQLERTLMMEIRESVNAFLERGEFDHAYHKIWSHMRFLTKFITFGIMYGRGAESLAKGELNCSVREAKSYVDMFFKRYPDFKAWLDKQEHKALHEGFVQNAFGFKRRWPLVTPQTAHEVKNQSWNTPVQGTAGQMCILALSRCQSELVRRDWGRVLFTVHDSIVFSIREDVLGEALHYLNAEMTKDVLNSGLPIVAEFEVGPTYKKVKEVKLLSENQWQFVED